MASPWAQLEQQATPPPPPVFAPVGQMPSAPPDVQATPQPVAALPTPGQEQINSDQQALQKVRWNQANPWGSTDNHPGKLGKIGHAFATLGNIAGDIFAPNVEANIPGSQLNMEKKEGSLAKRLNSEITDESQNQERGAQQASLEEGTREAPGKAASAEALQSAQTENIENPQDQWKAIPGVIGPNGEPVEIEGKSGKVRFGGVSGVSPVKAASQRPDTPEQQYIDEYAKLHPGTTVAEAERKYALDTQRPPQIAPIMMMVPNANGGSTATAIRPGMEVAPGAQTAAGLNSMNTPTTNQRTAAGRADTVLSMVPEVTGRLDSMKGQIGPEMGRWNDFMQGRVGTNNPDFAALRSDLLMMSSAVALAHAQGRLPENLRQEFDHAINAPKQTPENLKATINAMVPWLQKVKDQGGHPGEKPVLKYNQATGRLE